MYTKTTFDRVRDWAQTNWGLTLGIVIAIPFVLWIGYVRVQETRTPRTREAAVLPKRERAALREWPNQAPPPLPVLEALPFPDSSAWPPAALRHPETGELHSNAPARAEWLVTNHPSEELRREWPKLLEAFRGAVSVSDRLSNQTVGAFGTVSIDDARRNMPEAQPDAHGRFMLFTLNRYRIDTISSVRDAKVFESFVYHEWRHYLQYQDAVEAERWDEAATFYEDVPSGQMTEAQCAFHWQHELDAWRDTCLFTIQIDIVDYFELICPWVGDEAAFRQAMFNYDPDHVMIGGGGFQECLPVHARLAGHPNAEVFEPSP